MDGLVLPPDRAPHGYQVEALRAIDAGFRRGVRRMLVVLATGLGKTVLFALLPQIGFRRILFLAHRDFLLDAAEEEFRAWNGPAARCFREAGDDRAPLHANTFDFGGPRLVTAMTNSLGNARRLARYPRDEFDLVVIDEAHRIAAASYQRVVDHFDAPIVGLTATGFRSNTSDLSRWLDEVVFELAMPEAIDRELLAPLRLFRVATGTSIEGVRTTGGDYHEGALSAAVNNPARNARIVRAALDFSGRKGLVFAADRAHCRSLRDAFLAGGLSRVAIVDGETTGDERRQILGDLRTGELQHVVNCAVLTEGYNEPSLELGLMGRPTESPLLETQMLGRFTRKHPGKKDAAIVHFSDDGAGEDAYDPNRILGLPSSLDLRGGGVREARAALQRTLKIGVPFDALGRALSLEDFEQIANEYLAMRADRRAAREAARAEKLRRVPPLLGRNGARLPWYAYGETAFVLQAGGAKARIVVDALGKARAELWRKDGEGTSTRILALENSGLRDAIRAVEKDLRRNEGRLLDPNAAWRSRPASDAQKDALRRMRIPFGDTITRGEANDMISARVNEREARRAGGA